MITLNRQLANFLGVFLWSSTFGQQKPYQANGLALVCLQYNSMRDLPDVPCINLVMITVGNPISH